MCLPTQGPYRSWRGGLSTDARSFCERRQNGQSMQCPPGSQRQSHGHFLSSPAINVSRAFHPVLGFSGYLNPSLTQKMVSVGSTAGFVVAAWTWPNKDVSEPQRLVSVWDNAVMLPGQATRPGRRSRRAAITSSAASRRVPTSESSFRLAIEGVPAN